MELYYYTTKNNSIHLSIHSANDFQIIQLRTILETDIFIHHIVPILADKLSIVV